MSARDTSGMHTSHSISGMRRSAFSPKLPKFCDSARKAHSQPSQSPLLTEQPGQWTGGHSAQSGMVDTSQADAKFLLDVFAVKATPEILALPSAVLVKPEDYKPVPYKVCPYGGTSASWSPSIYGRRGRPDIQGNFQQFPQCNFFPAISGWYLSGISILKFFKSIRRFPPRQLKDSALSLPVDV